MSFDPIMMNSSKYEGSALSMPKACNRNSNSAETGGTAEERCLETLFASILSPMGRSSSFVPASDEMAALKEMAIRNNVLPLLYVQLLNGPGYETDHVRTFLQDINAYFLKSASISMRQEALEQEVLSLFRKEGVPAILLKGNAIARNIYKDENCRLSEDIDLLVKRSDVFRASRVLRDAGYFCEIEVPLEYRYVSIHHATFYRVQESIPLELHWLFGVPSFFDLTSGDIWDDVACDSQGNYTLSPELQIVLLLVHHHSHSFRQLKTLLDIVWTLWAYEAIIDWHRFIIRLKKAGLLKTAHITLAQISSLWHDANTKIRAAKSLASEMRKSGQRPPKLLTSYFSIDITGRRSARPSLDKIVKRLALDRPKAIIRSFIVLWPSRRTLGIRYGDRRLWRLPVNLSRFLLWQLKRWKI